ncbi:MucB/RseB C-terminal domain-containing protein [Lacimicrobium alkaliphilum]|uniref:Sigma-E factor regulatory protein RseB n=1 Tax=Lacimicrobium alkaliphilum TaxID=1526571 RepID=A0ABQ1RE84_9ALTE|nr:MucB/RseB C-terminal domain-containing protein [Lacimicrobium alkaliphilum]GGD67601.1 sigma-E factor regulatory protein RseB [Lacimicrobium alkaliphilum]
MSCLRALMILLLVVGQPVSAQQQDGAERVAKAWLEKMAWSLRNLNYQISFVLLYPNGDFEPYTWRHALVADQEMEHLSMLNGPGREVVRVADKVSYFEPNVPPYSLQSEVINGPIPAELFRQPANLAKGYDFVMVGTSRVSGRLAQQLRIVSKDKSRYSYNLWLDKQTALILRLDMLNMQGEPLEQVQVTSMNVTAQPDEYFSRIEAEKMPQRIAPADRPSQNADWQFGWLPAGMMEVRRSTHRLPLTGQWVDYMMLSDGMVDVSVYLQKLDSDLAENGWLQQGANTLLSLQNGQMEITVVGKVPPQTASSIAKSISLSGRTSRD